MSDTATTRDEVPVAETVVATVASIDELNQWRSTCPLGSRFTYFTTDASLLRLRSRDVAIDEIGATVWSLYMAGRVLLIQKKAGEVYDYIAIACNRPAVRQSIWDAEPPTKMKKTKAAA